MADNVIGVSPESFADLTSRVNRLELAQHDMVRNHFEMHSEFTGIKTDLKYIKEGQDKVSQGIARLLWAVVLSVIGAIMAFVIQGGLMVS